jgi:hypothetical protein
MHLCTCVCEEGDDGETVSSETPSLLSYTLRYVSFAAGLRCENRMFFILLNSSFIFSILFSGV